MAEKIYTTADVAKRWNINTASVVGFMRRHDKRATFERGGQLFFNQTDFDALDAAHAEALRDLRVKKAQRLAHARDVLADQRSAKRLADADAPTTPTAPVPNFRLADAVRDISERLAKVEAKILTSAEMSALIKKAVLDAFNTPSDPASGTEKQGEFQFDDMAGTSKRKTCPVCETSQTEFHLGGFCTACHETYKSVTKSEPPELLDDVNLIGHVRFHIQHLFHDAHVREWKARAAHNA